VLDQPFGCRFETGSRHFHPARPTRPLTASAVAANPEPYSGLVMVKIERPFKAFVKVIPSALKKHKFNIVGVAYANCAAKSLGKTIPGNRENLFFAS
jgi:hypothetical protein